MKLEKTSIKGILEYHGKKENVYYGNFWTGTYSKRIKIGKKSDFKKIEDAYIRFQELVELEKNKNKSIEEEKNFTNYMTIDELSKLYFEMRTKRVKKEVKAEHEKVPLSKIDTHPLFRTKIKSVKSDKSVYNKHIGSHKICKEPINRIKKEMVDDFKDSLEETTLHSKSKYNIGTILKAIVNYGIEAEIINVSNPFTNKRLEIKKGKDKRKRSLNDEEIQFLLTEAKKYNYPRKVNNVTVMQNYNVYLAIYLCVITAGRKETILNIRKKDINIKTKEITLTNFKVENRTYTQILTDGAIQWFKEKVFPHYKDEEYLIRPQRRNKDYLIEPLENLPRSVPKLLNELFNQGEEDRLKRVYFHTIRRSIATGMVRKGINLSLVQKKLDHANITQTMDYLNLNDEDLAKANITYTDSLFENGVKENSLKEDIPKESYNKDNKEEGITMLNDLEIIEHKPTGYLYFNTDYKGSLGNYKILNVNVLDANNKFTTLEIDLDISVHNKTIHSEKINVPTKSFNIDLLINRFYQDRVDELKELCEKFWILLIKQDLFEDERKETLAVVFKNQKN